MTQFHANRATVITLLGALLINLTIQPCPAADPPIRFRDATQASGIRFVHTDGSTGKCQIMETVASGLGLIDYDADGYPDIFFLNGVPPSGGGSNASPVTVLYHNNHDGTFTDVSAKTGAGIPCYGLGCVVADFDNDGNEDIFISCYGPHHLLHNNGNGTFTDITDKSGLGKAWSDGIIGAGCVFFDYDRDGFLDLYIGHYLRFDEAKAKAWTIQNVPTYCSPRSFDPIPSLLFHNEKNGTFRDVSDASGIGHYKGYAMGVVSSDFDGDGWPDLYIGNDEIENFLFHNKKDGTFEEIGLASGVAYDQYGDPQGTMGANVGDFDGDGKFDIIVTDYQEQVNTLYRNLGNLQFQDVTASTGAGAGSLPLVTWGCGLVDFDNDGVPELFVASGHLQDTVEQYDKNTTYKQRPLLFRQRGGRFIDVTAESGGPLMVPRSSRGVVFGDLNNDGKIDMVILNSRTAPEILINETVTTSHWTTLKLIGTRSNRSAVGALARVTVGGRTQADEVRAGRGYQSAEDLRLHFGLGTNTAIDKLEVRWPTGATATWTNLPADRILTLTESK